MKQNITLGILGGGQLGRMSAIAAARLGYSVIIFCPEEGNPASEVALKQITAAYDDKEALQKFSAETDIISYEFENIPVETVDYLNSLKPNSVQPGTALLNVAQDRIKEKSFVNNLGIRTARWAPIKTLNDIKAVLADWKSDGFILKTTRFGYDGKGQIKCDAHSFINDVSLQNFLESTKNQELIMEDLVNFSCEISIIVARDTHGKTETYGPMLNNHKNHILNTTTVPAGVSQKLEEQAISDAVRIADSVNLVGVLTVEFFALPDDTVLVNEIAPRTHNSGHWSMDACAVSQFENHVRCVCGLPVGSTARHSDAMMLNLIGDDIKIIDEYIRDPNCAIHLYGKKEVRSGRKMGHINFIKPKTA